MIDLMLRARAEALLYDYAALLDAERFAEWLALFDPNEATYEVLSRENRDLGLPAPIMSCYTPGMIQDRVAMLMKGVLTYRHWYLLRQVSNVRARRDDDGTVHVNAALVVYQSSEEGVSSLYMVARYEGGLIDANDTLRIQRMTVVVDSFGIDTMLAVPL